MMSGVRRISVTVGQPPEQGLRDIVTALRPSWDSRHVVFKEVEGGQVNALYSCGLEQDVSQDDVILVRVYGAGTENYVDREREILVMRLAHQAGLGAQLYCRFNNGLAYKFWPGHSLAKEEVNSETLEKETARTMARLHLIDYEQVMTEIGESERIEQFSKIHTLSDYFKTALKKLEDPSKNHPVGLRHGGGFLKTTDALTHIEKLQMQLEMMDIPTGLCHNDFNPGNIILNPKTGGIHLVDWEFAGIDYIAHDAAVYFAGKCVLDDCAEESLELYPDKAFQLKWIRWYLEYRAIFSGKTEDQVTDAMVKHMFKASTLFSLQHTLVVAFYYLSKAASAGSLGENDPLRKARHFMKLHNIIKEIHSGTNGFPIIDVKD